MNNQNPLAKHFRQPVLYLKLPSNGKYWPEESINMPLTRELPIYPLTARDEIILRTPDALLNGSSVVEIIHSCIPNIINAWKMPNIDADSIMIAIRIASYGSSMSVDTSCYHCEAEQKFMLNLNEVMDKIKPSKFDEVFDVGDLKVKFKPLTYFDVNKDSLATFEENRIKSISSDDSLPTEEKIRLCSTHLNSMINLNLNALADSTEYIMTEGIKVTQTDYLVEFYTNCSRAIVEQIKTYYSGLLEHCSLKPISHKCDECGKDFNVKVAFDYSHFFV